MRRLSSLIPMGIFGHLRHLSAPSEERRRLHSIGGGADCKDRNSPSHAPQEECSCRKPASFAVLVQPSKVAVASCVDGSTVLTREPSTWCRSDRIVSSIPTEAILPTTFRKSQIAAAHDSSTPEKRPWPVRGIGPNLLSLSKPR